MERGQLRSGGRFAARNRPFYTSLRELQEHHQRLLLDNPAVSHRLAYIGGTVGVLAQTTVRFPINSINSRASLFDIFTDLFQQVDVNNAANGGFEVVITFNAVLYSHETNTYSVFYGHDFRENNVAGTAQEISLQNVYIIRNIDEVVTIPTRINVASLLHAHRDAFSDSNVRIHSILNIVYLIYRYVDSSIGSRAGRRSNSRR